MRQCLQYPRRNRSPPFNRMLKRLLAAFSLRSEARRTETVRLAPSLAAALPEDLFEHPQDF